MSLRPQPIRPRRCANKEHVVSACKHGPVHEVHVSITYKSRRPAVGFPHPVIKTLFEAALRRGLVNRKGTVDVRAIGNAARISWRMLYYAKDGANISLRAAQQIADLVGYEIVARKVR